MGGAKNHMLILPDANLDDVANALMGAAYGSAGERCMAISVGVCVGDKVADKLIDILKPRVEALQIGSSLDTGLEMGPLVTKEHREKVMNYIQMAQDEGSRLVVDGRDFVCEGHENGYFLGGSLIDNVTPENAVLPGRNFWPGAANHARRLFRRRYGTRYRSSLW